MLVGLRLDVRNLRQVKGVTVLDHRFEDDTLYVLMDVDYSQTNMHCVNEDVQNCVLFHTSFERRD